MPTPYIDIQNLTKSFGAQVLFRNISFSIAEGQCVGLIAQNGTGKSTLLSILTGHEGYDEGKIIFRRDLKIGYLRQSPVFPFQKTVLEACFHEEKGEKEEQREERILKAKQILTQLKLRNLDQPVGELSGGQQKRVALAAVLIKDPDFLILDEPTNHLDLQMIEWLENYLGHGKKTLLMVTHDRFFLDRVCNTILELDDQTIYTYRGNYAYYLEKRQQRIDNRKAEIARANNLYRKELEWMRRMPQARGHKARYREEAFYELERKAKQRVEDRQMKLKATNLYIGSKIFECQYVSKAFEQEQQDENGEKNREVVILKDFYYNFARFEKMGIVGSNGTGKSTFIKLLLGFEQPNQGKFDIGETVRFGYFSQEGLHFRDDQRVIDIVRDIADYIDLGQGRHFTATQFLQHFMFTPEQQYNYVSKLSGGERRKLYLCTVLMRNPNFLVLDEPTNDLDIQTLQVLEEYLQDFPGCVIIVSHDRYFTDKVVDHLLVFHGQGKIQDFPGNYSQYREWQSLKEEDQQNPSVVSPAKPKKTKNLDTDKRKLTFKEKRELEQIEKEIEQLEAEKKLLEESLCSGILSVQELTEKSIRLPIVNQAIDEKTIRWLELCEIEN